MGRWSNNAFENTPEKINNNQYKTGDILDIKSLDDYYNKMQELEKLINKERTKEENERLKKLFKVKESQDRKRAKDQKDYELSLIDELEEYKTALEKNNITNIKDVEKKYIEMHSKDKKKKELDLIKKVHEEELNYYKDLVKRKEKDDKKEQKRLEKQIDLYRKINELKSTKTKNPIKKIGKTIAADALYNTKTLQDGLKEVKDNLSKNIMGLLTNLGNQINSLMSDYANLKGGIDARLQGSNKSFNGIIKTFNDVTYSGLIDSRTLYSNLNTLIKEGVVSNVEQKALLMTLSEEIAGTFSVNNNSLKQIIRIQQQDSTAARLGMESYLTKFLNTFVESTEYLTTTFDGVADSLLEASSLMSTAAESTEFEYTVQKWLGSLTGVGFSSNASNSIAQALGYLGSGNINQLSSSNMQNLLIMAANKVGLDFSELLINGLDSNSTNNLMYGLTRYLQEVGNSQNNVIKSQLADVFGVTINDLKAVNNLTVDDLKNIRKETLTFSGMYEELGDQFKQLGERIGIAKLLENSFNNFQYGTAMNIANNPGLYSLWKVTDLIQSVTGGINIPTASVMGNFVDLNTTAENLMKTGIIGASTLGSIGKIANGIKSNFDGSVLLDALNINSNNTLMSRGSRSIKNSKRRTGKNISAASYIGNGDSNSYLESTLGAAEDEGNRKLKTKQNEMADSDPVVKYLAESVGLEDKMSAILNALNNINNNGISVKNVEAFKSIMPQTTAFGDITGIQ